MHSLKVPQQLSSFSIKRQYRVRVKVVADPIPAVEVHHRGTGRRVENSVLHVKRHARPVIRRAGTLPSILWPSLIARLSRQWNRVKCPADLARAYIVGTNITRRRRMSFRIASADDDQVPVDHAGCGERNGLRFEIATEILAQIDAALLSKRLDRLPGFGVEAVKKVHHAGEEAKLVTFGPGSESARRLRATSAGIEFPFERARGGIERDDFLGRRVGVERAAHNQRVGLNLSFFAGIKGPRDPQAVHICATDLRE